MLKDALFCINLHIYSISWWNKSYLNPFTYGAWHKWKYLDKRKKTIFGKKWLIVLVLVILVKMVYIYVCSDSFPRPQWVVTWQFLVNLGHPLVCSWSWSSQLAVWKGHEAVSWRSVSGLVEVLKQSRWLSVRDCFKTFLTSNWLLRDHRDL